MTDFTVEMDEQGLAWPRFVYHRINLGFMCPNRRFFDSFKGEYSLTPFSEAERAEALVHDCERCTKLRLELAKVKKENAELKIKLEVLTPLELDDSWKKKKR